MKQTTRQQTKTATAEIAYRLPGGTWKRRTFREHASGVFFRSPWTLHEFIEHLACEGAEVRWGDDR